jgi:NAD(P)-dependent dehydrogenase (short-subunit alcohol dehydrogenase family)
MRLRRFVPVPSLDRRLCLVTGAASGIGRATATAAARSGARLVITDVNAPLLAAVASELGDAVALSRPLDISDVDAVRSLAAETHDRLGSIDVAMNIAGIATWGAVENLSHEQWRRTIDVNLMGPIHVIESFVPEMIRAGRGGQLVNISSAAGLVGLPWHAPYSATKYGLRGVSEVLRFDLRRHGIGVTLVCPGGVATPIVDAVDIAGIDREKFHASPLSERFVRRAKSPEHVAQRILDGITRNRYLVYTSGDIRLLHLTQRVLPHTYAAMMRTANNVFVRQMRKVAGSGPA